MTAKRLQVIYARDITSSPELTRLRLGSENGSGWLQWGKRAFVAVSCLGNRFDCGKLVAVPNFTFLFLLWLRHGRPAPGSRNI